jgi:hypothetical protein
MSTSNVLVGHKLLNEGRIYENGAYRIRVGPTRCTCGNESPSLPSDNARRNWHRGHKEAVRAGEGGDDA